MIVVLVVAVLLSGIAVPLIAGYVEDDRRARAESEIRSLAGAVTAFYKDLGIFPTRNGKSSDATVRCLYTGAAVPTPDIFVGSGTHGFYQWAASGTNGDSFDHQLRDNSPQGSTEAAYSTTGKIRWRGPYVSVRSPLDPWGRPYLINVHSSFSTHGTDHRRIFVLSAGPDGRINTNERARASDDIAGDDIAMIIYQRP